MRFLAFRLNRDCTWVMSGWNANISSGFSIYMCVYIYTLYKILYIEYCLWLQFIYNIYRHSQEPLSAKIWDGGLSHNSKPSRHGCISDAFLRRLIQRLRDISKRADFQTPKMPRGRRIKDVSSETSKRSLRFSQRCLWVASETAVLSLQAKLPVHLATTLY